MASINESLIKDITKAYQGIVDTNLHQLSSTVLVIDVDGQPRVFSDYLALLFGWVPSQVFNF